MKKLKAGFTLIELLIVVAMLALVITGMIKLFIYTSVLAEISGNKTVAVGEAQDMLEAIREHNYDDIAVDYASGGTPGNIFALDELNGKGAIYIDNSNPELLILKVVVSWRNKYGRIIGEDANLDGDLDTGEDLDGDTELSSPATLITMLTRR
jgi:prepilin-type N-terminal cleavage/methylation domain-containing protein